ncbi:MULTISPECIES: nitroreductase family protein [Delftia]|uniref:Nitroreductase family protein n=1 Tax=Delftia deserti TaxID=1651218 RepID=A0ABW5EQJ6_9BURK|nr:MULTISPECIES: nitroreductase family protein [Delftia]MBL8353948.1 nitroreductase family protein [Delftia acidovorans]
MSDAANDAQAGSGQPRMPDWLGRRSVRRYLPQPIAPETIEALLHAAGSAPSAHNRQPWRFAVIRQRERQMSLADAMGQRLRRDRQVDRDSEADIEADVLRSRERICGAATVIVVCLSMEDMDRYPDSERARNEHQMAVQSTAMAGQNLLLAAHAAGLGACWLCAPLFCPEAVRCALELPVHWEPQGLITLGHPANAGKPFVRRPLHEITQFITSGDIPC